MPKVSICIPTYNNPQEVKRLLASIAAQDFQDYEVIVSDDSTDGLIERLVREDSPVRVDVYVHNEKPLGHIFNWNHALSFAKGEMVKIMFSDDWFTDTDSLRGFVELLEENPAASLGFSGSMQVSLPEGKGYARTASKPFLDRLKEDHRKLLLGNEIGAPSAVIYRACGALFDEESNWASDMFLYFEILKDNPRFAYTPKSLVSIGVHEEQYTGMFAEKDLRKFTDLLHMYQKYDLSGCPACRRFILENIVMFGQGCALAKRCGLTERQYMRERARYFWKNTVLGYWNGLLHKLGIECKDAKAAD